MAPIEGTAEKDKKDKAKASKEEIDRSLDKSTDDGNMKLTCSDAECSCDGSHNKSRPKENVLVEPNRCGSGGYVSKVFVDPIGNIFHISERCCNPHDRCYSGCNNNRHVCDAIFENCMIAVCNELRLKFIKYYSCRTIAKVFSTTVDNFGEPYFASAQKDACTCDPPLNMTKHLNVSLYQRSDHRYGMVLGDAEMVETAKWNSGTPNEYLLPIYNVFPLLSITQKEEDVTKQPESFSIAGWTANIAPSIAQNFALLVSALSIIVDAPIIIVLIVIVLIVMLKKY